MTQKSHNPFSTARLEYPTEQKPHYDRYARTGVGSSAQVDKTPFPRMIDLWWAGLSVSVRKGLEPVDIGKGKTTFFIPGSIFDSDPWRIQVLQLVALRLKGDPEILLNPPEIITLANGLAAAGIPDIVEMLTSGDEEPIWNLSNATEKLLSE